MKKDGFSSGGQQKLECNCPNEQQQVESKIALESTSRVARQVCKKFAQNVATFLTKNM
jgi:hypothetical protein